MNNLIENLGGYEKVKSIRDINIKEFEGDASGVTIHYMGNSITQEDLEESLLEYRRQHNIFEVNDWVWHKETLSRIIEINKNGYAYGESELFDVTTIFLKDAAHATDEEIAAGHRL